MAFRSADTPFSFVLGGALALSLGFAACGSYVPAYAVDPADWTSVDIRNGNFATPALTGTTAIPKPQVPDFWVTDREDGPGVSLPVIHSTNAGHPKSLQAVELNYVTVSGTTETPVKGTLQTRLWGVRKGTDIEVSYDVTTPTATMIPATSVTVGTTTTQLAPACAPGARGYKVASSDSSGAEFQPVAKTSPATAIWQTEVYKFKAAEDNPKFVFTSTEATKCGAVVANLSAKADRNTFPAPDQFIKRNNLPWRVYEGVKEINWDVMKKTLLANQTNIPCANGLVNPVTAAGDCTFTVDPSRTYSYFAESRILGNYSSLNCTRNPITDSRKTVSWTEEGFDPFNQEANSPKPGVALKPDNTGNEDYELGTKDAGGTTLSTGATTRFNAVQAGFQKYEANNKLSNTETPLISSRKSSQDVAIQVQPGEASWIEVQAARERIGGYFSTGMTALTSTSVQNWFVIDTLLDFPSSKLGDRLYQRTGPMTSTEQDHCLTDRPNLVTPDNNGTSAIRPKQGVTPPAVTGQSLVTQSLTGDRSLAPGADKPAERVTRSVPLTPVAE